MHLSINSPETQFQLRNSTSLFWLYMFYLCNKMFNEVFGFESAENESKLSGALMMTVMMLMLFWHSSRSPLWKFSLALQAVNQHPRWSDITNVRTHRFIWLWGWFRTSVFTYVGSNYRERDDVSTATGLHCSYCWSSLLDGLTVAVLISPLLHLRSHVNYYQELLGGRDSIWEQQIFLWPSGTCRL